MTDVFSAEAPPVPEVIDETKYAAMTPEDLIKKAVNADTHIARIEAENAAFRQHTEQLRSQVAEKLAMEDFLKKLQATAPKETPLAPQGDATKGLSKEDVETLLAQNDTRRKHEENIATATSELVKKFGDKTADQVAKRASELGYNKDEFKALAATRPAAFLALFSTAPTPDTLRQPTSSTSTVNLSNRTGAKNKAYYEKMKQTHRGQWESIETQNEIMAEAMKQGDAFYTP